MMKSAAQEWFEEGEVSSFQKGRQGTILQILQYRFVLTAVLTKQIAERLGRIKQIETLEALTNLALQVFALPEFQQKLLALSTPPSAVNDPQ